MTLFLIGIALLVSNLVPTLAGALAARALGIGVPRVALGVWKPRWTASLGHTALVVTPWQFASSFRFKERATLDLYPDVPGSVFEEAHPLLRSFLAIAGPLLLFVATLPILGGVAVTSLVNGFPQVLAGALQPLSRGQEMLAAFSDHAGTEPVMATAFLVTKLVAFALLPLPPNAGGAALLHLVQWRRPGMPPWAAAVPLAGILCILAISASWVVALLVFVFRGLDPSGA